MLFIRIAVKKQQHFDNMLYTVSASIFVSPLRLQLVIIIFLNYHLGYNKSTESVGWRLSEAVLKC